MVLDGNIQIEIEALWDVYNMSTPAEQVYIMQEIERLYILLRGTGVANRARELEPVG